jgi:hypothetical protein
MNDHSAKYMPCSADLPDSLRPIPSHAEGLMNLYLTLVLLVLATAIVMFAINRPAWTRSRCW